MLLTIVQLVLSLAVAGTDSTEMHLTFTTQIGGQDDLYVAGLTSGRIRQITNHRAKDSHGVPSPDGTRLVFCSERNGWWKIWVAAADGSHAQQLTNPASGADYHPDWSPDGEHIVYVSGGTGNGDIMVMNKDGSEATNISQNTGRDNFPMWSPDGHWIAYASDRDGNWGIYVTDPAGRNTRRVSDEREAIEPSWYPDSQRLIYQAATDGNFDLYTVELDSDRVPVRLTTTEFDEKRPTVSSDGRWIAFESDRDGGSNIFVMHSDGGPVRRLTLEGYNYGPHWWPNEYTGLDQPSTPNRK